MFRKYFGQDDITLEEVRAKYKLSSAYISKLIKAKYIHVIDRTSYGGKVEVDFENQMRLKTLSEHPEYRKKVLDFNPSSYYDYCPELIDYHPFHDFVDRYCWLIKLFYTDKKDIQKRKYRLDILFQNFLIKNKFSLQKLSKKLPAGGNKDKVIFHLQKGWYNELSRSLPLNAEYLTIGTSVKGSVADATSVSWNITQTYYSIYEYTNSMAFLDNKVIDTREHRKPTKIFTNGTLGKLKNNIIFYPFFLSSHNTSPIKYPKHSNFEYASYPRDKSKQLQDVNKDVVKVLKSLSKDNNGSPACLVDFLYEFRVWSNYTGVETIIKLRNGHLLEYLYKNLGILNFFVGGMSELSVMAKIGEEEYLKVLNNFANDYVLKQPQFKEHILLIPIFIRHRIYKHLGIISADIPFLSSMYSDPIVMLDLDNVQVKKQKFDSGDLPTKLSGMSIKEIAQFIIDDWGKQGSVPRTYLEPMLEINSLDEMCFAEPATFVVGYFLGNSSGWRGDTAKVVKKHLEKRLSDHHKDKLVVTPFKKGGRPLPPLPRF